MIFNMVGGFDTSIVTAQASDILLGKVVVDADGNPVVGTIPTQSAMTVTPTTSIQVAVSAGTYVSGDITVAANEDLSTVISNIQTIVG